MGEIIDYVGILPHVILYLVFGYIFMFVFKVTAFSTTEQKGNALISYVTSGFVVWQVINLIPIYIEPQLQILITCLVIVIMAYMLGRFTRSKYFSIFLEKLRIYTTLNDYYWDELMDQRFPMKVIVKYDDREYCGMVYVFEGNSNAPHIVLGSYIVNTSGQVRDYSNDPARLIVLDTSKAKSVEVLYSKDSEVTKENSRLCKYSHGR